MPSPPSPSPVASPTPPILPTTAPAGLGKARAERLLCLAGALGAPDLAAGAPAQMSRVRLSAAGRAAGSAWAARNGGQWETGDGVILIVVRWGLLVSSVRPSS